MIDQFASIPSCEICTISYDLENRIPRIVPCCGKTLCRKCVDKIIRDRSCVICPWCKRSHQAQTELKTNFQLLGVIEENLKWEICADHGEAIKLFCLQDRQKVCAYCHSLGNKPRCQGHDLVSLASIKPEADRGRKKFENQLELLEKKYQESDKKLVKDRETMEDMICRYFDEQQHALKASKIKALHNFNIVCEKERTRFGENFGEESSIRSELKMIISNHMNFLRNPDPKEIIDRDYSSLENRIKYFTGPDVNGLSFEKQLFQIVPKMKNSLLEHSSSMMKSWDTFAEIAEKEIKTDFPVEFNNSEKAYNSKKSALKFSSVLKFTIKGASLTIDECEEDIDTELAKTSLQKITKITFNMKTLKLENEDWDRLSQVFTEIGTKKPISVRFDSKNKNHSITKVSRLFSILCQRPEILFELVIRLILTDEILQLVNFILPQLSIISSLHIKIGAADISRKHFNEFLEKLHSITPRLERFSINLKGTKLPLSIFTELFVKMPVLIDLSLDLSKIPNLSGETISPLLDDSKNLMPKLEKLALDVSQTKISVSDAAVLKDRFRHIKSFELELKDPESEKAQNQVSQSQVSPTHPRYVSSGNIFSSRNIQNQPVRTSAVQNPSPFRSPNLAILFGPQ